MIYGVYVENWFGLTINCADFNEYNWPRQSSYVIPTPNCVLFPDRYSPLGLAQWQLLYHHPTLYFLAQSSESWMSLSLSFVENIMSLIPLSTAVKQSSTNPSTEIISIFWICKTRPIQLGNH